MRPVHGHSAGSLPVLVQLLDDWRGAQPPTAAPATRKLRHVSPFAPRPLTSLGMHVMVSTGALSGGSRLRPSSLFVAGYRTLFALFGFAVLAVLFGPDILRQIATWAM